MVRKNFKLHRNKRVVQDSAFLRLPGEIRNMIYKATLLKEGAIDLWPAKFIDGDDPKIIPLNTHTGPLSPWRLQDDLAFVRQEMATGLLGTCKAVFQEAWHVFWSQNTWRFSNDVDWVGIARFMDTVGARVLSSIQRLELSAPVGPQLSGWRERQPEPGNDDHFPPLRLLGGRTYLQDNVKLVFERLKEASPDDLLLTFVLPANRYVSECTWWDEVPFQPGQQVLSPSNHGLYKPISTMFVNNVVEGGEKVARSMRMVIEPSAILESGPEGPERLAYNGIEVVCKPGSWYVSCLEPRQEGFVKEEQRWEVPAECCELKAYVGFVELFEVEEQEVERGRVKRGRPRGRYRYKFERVLKGFGGCGFVRRKGWDCYGCNKVGVMGTKGAAEYHPSCTAGNICTGDYRWVIEVRNMGRAIMSGRVDTGMMLLENRDLKMKST